MSVKISDDLLCADDNRAFVLTIPFTDCSTKRDETYVPCLIEKWFGVDLHVTLSSTWFECGSVSFMLA